MASQTFSSYYDVIGLLVVRDSVDSVEGIPLEAFSKHPIYSKGSILSPNASSTTKTKSPIKKYPPLLSDENKSAQLNRKYHGLLDHSPISPNVSTYSQELSFKTNLVPAPDAPHYGSAGNVAAPPQVPGAGPLAPTPLQHHHSNIPVPPAPSADGTSSSRSLPIAASASSSSSATKDSGKYTVEICPICQRHFPGAKAATHKQQHIRRLHPEHYRPKKGGKRRVLYATTPTN